MPDWPTIADAVADALEAAPDTRADVIRSLCLRPDGTLDRALQAEVESLVAAALSDDALVSPVEALVGRHVQAGQTVGPWLLGEALGEGGQGVVYRAIRADGATDRTVALKRLRPGPGQRTLAARLQAERRTLARLEHPGIARLYDGGTDQGGVPYLVMELVDGAPITEWAEGRTVRERVALFAEACDAVAYAHARLVVHRDLKPSNVLVGADGTPKLLDFGIAKILDADADGALTRTGGAMTPAYAAPEQLAGGDITTATDVYALGVLLYEVLAGQRPHDLKGLSPAAAERAVQTAPPPPSAVAPPDRAAALRGDLDTIVQKALAPEPERRYASADALADDLRRHLANEPVEARAPTARYRAGRFVRRHRAGVAAAAVAVLALLTGTGIAVWQANEARAERRVAERVNAFVAEMLASADPYDAGGDREVTVLDAADAAAARVADDLAAEPAAEAGVRLALGATYHGVDAFDRAEAQYARAVALRERLYGDGHRATAQARAALAGLLVSRSRFAEGDSVAALALPVLRRAPGAYRADYAAALGTSGVAALLLGDLGRARRELSETSRLLAAHPAPTPTLVRKRQEAQRYLGLALQEAGDYAASDAVLVPLADEMRALGARAPGHLGGVLNSLAWNREYLGDIPAIQPLLTESLAFRERRFGPDHTETAYGANDLAYYYHYYGDDVPRAEALYRRALGIFRTATGDDYAAVPTVLSNLALLARATDRPGEAVQLLEEAVATEREILGPDHPDHAATLLNLGRTYVVTGRAAEGERRVRESLRIRRAAYDGPHTNTALSLAGLAEAVLAQGRTDEGITRYRQAAAMQREVLGPDHIEVADIELPLAEALAARAQTGDRRLARRLAEHVATVYRAVQAEEPSERASSRLRRAAALAR